MAMERKSARQIIKELLADGKEWKVADITKRLERKGCHPSLTSVTLSFMARKNEAVRTAPGIYRIVSEQKPFRQTVRYATEKLLENKLTNDSLNTVEAVKKYCYQHRNKDISRINAIHALKNYNPIAVAAVFPVGVQRGWLERARRGIYHWKPKSPRLDNNVALEQMPQEKVVEEPGVNIKDALILLNQAKRYMAGKETPEYHLMALAGLYLQGKMK